MRALPERQASSSSSRRSVQDVLDGFPTIPDRGGNGKKGGSSSKNDLQAIARLAYGPEIIAAAKRENLDPRLLAGLVKVESNFNARAVSSAGAAGLTQLMPGTAGDLGVTDRFDPVQNLMGGARYLRQMIDMFGSLEAALRAYNQGPGNQQRFPGGVSQEAVQYPGKVLSAAQSFGFDGQGLADLNVDAYAERLELTIRQKEAAAELSQEFSREVELRRQANDLSRALLEIENTRLDRIAEIEEKVAAADQAELKAQVNKLASLEAQEKINDIAESTLATAQAFVDAGVEEAELLAAKQAYIEDGINPALAEQYAQIDKQVQKQIEQLDLMQGVLTAELARVDANSEVAKSLQEQIDKIKQLKGEVSSTGENTKQRVAEGDQGAGKIQSYMDQLQTELADTEGMIVSLAQTVEGEIGSAMSNAITGLIDGTKTAQEAFADMFKNIGKAFIDMATQMIAKALVMKALGILTGGLGGGGGGGGGLGSIVSGGGFGSGSWNAHCPLVVASSILRSLPSLVVVTQAMPRVLVALMAKVASWQ